MIVLLLQILIKINNLHRRSGGISPRASPSCPFMHNYGVKASLSEAEQLYSKILLLLIPSHEHLPDSVPLTSLKSVLSSWQEELLSSIRIYLAG